MAKLINKIKVFYYIVKMIIKYNIGNIKPYEKKALGLLLLNIKYNLLNKLKDVK